MKKSLKKDRWQPLDLGTPANYTEQAIISRWEKSRQDWLHVSHHNTLNLQSEKNLGKSNENDVRGTETTSTISSDPENTERR
jgi:hypothetical protein